MNHASRISQNEIAHLRTRLSERDWSIIRFVDSHHYVATTQMRRVFFAAHATQSAATRACTRVLDRLLLLRILTRLERRIGGSRHGSAAFVWCLDVIGERLARADNQPRRRFHEPSYQFLTHTLAITETHVQLREAERANFFTLSRIEIETEAWRPYLTPSGTRSILKPDLMVTLTTTDYADHWYIEIDLATESLPVLLRKCRAYEDYRRTGAAQAEHGVFPRVLWVMPTQARIARLQTAVATEPRLPDRLFAYTMPDRLIRVLTGPP